MRPANSRKTPKALCSPQGFGMFAPGTKRRLSRGECEFRAGFLPIFVLEIPQCSWSSRPAAAFQVSIDHCL